MSAAPPQPIRSRRQQKLSDWVTLVEKTVELPGQAAAVFHNLLLDDYVVMVARTAGGRFPLVRQYRPAVEAFTWELPGGTLDAGETAEQACRRELQEETGLVCRKLVHLSTTFTDTGRLANKIHAFYVEADEPAQPTAIEQGLELRFLACEDIERLIAAGELSNFFHVGTFALARMRRLF